MWDIEVPDYHARIRDGEVFVNPLRKEYYNLQETANVPLVLSHPSGCTVTYSNADRLLVDNGIFLDTTSRRVREDVLRRTASTMAWAELDRAYFEALSFLAELKQTILFMLNPLKALRGRYRSIYRKKLPRGVSLAEYLGDNWLAYRYGIRPMVSDYRSLMAAFAAESNIAPKRYIARGSASAKLAWHENNPSSFSIFEMDNDVKTSEEVLVRSGIIYEVDKKSIYGLSYTDLPLAVWEFLPFSFILDWFINTGDFLAAIKPKPGVKILGTWTTTRRDCRSESTSTLSGVTGGTYSLVLPGSYTHTASRVTTSRDATLLPPTFTLKHEAFEADLGIGKVLDSLALTRELLSTRKRGG
jgi:hypothetical protein